MPASIGPAESGNGNMVAVIHPSPRLCPRCTSFPWPSNPDYNEPMFQDLTLSDTFYCLQNSADRGCALCRFVWLSIVNDCTLPMEVMKSLTNGLAKGSVVLRLFICNGQLLLTPIIKHEGELVLRSAVMEYELAKSSEIELLGGMKSRHIKAFIGDNVQQELADLFKNQIQPWIESCRGQHAYHESCGTKQDSSSLPTRLVDVSEIDDPLVKLVDVRRRANIQEFTYLILSYCWGNGNDNSKTTEDNLEMRLRGFTVSALPKTVRDAILLTRMMGFRYLWVDAMCIIQGPNGDFHSESPRMGDYYSHAACCISASAANDSSEGILTERPIARFPMDDIALRLASHQTDELRYHLFKANDYNPSLKHSLLMSPITKRGWCLQETALPKRILHWTAQGLYLECQSSLFLEGRKTPLEDSPFSKADSSPRVVMRMPDKDILFYNGWYQLVAQFSNTQLTYETDRLYAIHGLASILIQRLKAEYFNGLFRTSLAEGLLWYHSNLEHESYKRPINAQLPSWCWASSCPVRFMRIDQTPVFITDDHPERPLQFPTHSEALNMVESTAPRLYIRAPVIQLLIGRNNKAFVKDKVSGHTEPCSCTYFLDRNRRVMQSMPYTPAVNGEWEQDQSVSVLWLPVGQAVRYFNSPIVGLLVHELPEEGKGVYRRYGVLEYYKMQDQENRSFRDVEDIILI